MRDFIFKSTLCFKSNFLQFCMSGWIPGSREIVHLDSLFSLVQRALYNIYHASFTTEGIKLLKEQREANKRLQSGEELRGLLLFLLRRGRTLKCWCRLATTESVSPALSYHLLLRQRRQSVRGNQSGWSGPGAPLAVREKVPRLAAEVSKNRVIAIPNSSVTSQQ